MVSEKPPTMHDGDEGVRAAQESTSEKISNARREGRTGRYDETDRRRQGEADGR